MSSSSSSSSSSYSSSSESSSSSSQSSRSSSSSSTSFSSSSSSFYWVYPRQLDEEVGEITGYVVAGEIENVWVDDYDQMILGEFNETPGSFYKFDFASVPDSTMQLWVELKGFYDGSHYVQMKLWNFTLSQWDSIDVTMNDGVFDRTYTANMPTSTGDYIDSGLMYIALNHPSKGVEGDMIRIKYLRVYSGSSSSVSSSSSSS